MAFRITAAQIVALFSLRQENPGLRTRPGFLLPPIGKKARAISLPLHFAHDEKNSISGYPYPIGIPTDWLAVVVAIYRCTFLLHLALRLRHFHSNHPGLGNGVCCGLAGLGDDSEPIYGTGSQQVQQPDWII